MSCRLLGFMRSTTSTSAEYLSQQTSGLRNMVSSAAARTPSEDFAVWNSRPPTRDSRGVDQVCENKALVSTHSANSRRSFMSVPLERGDSSPEGRGWSGKDMCWELRWERSEGLNRR